MGQGSHDMVSMGSYVIIWPDKKIFNSQDKKIEDLFIQQASVTQVNIYGSGSVFYQKSMDVYCENASAFHKGDVVKLHYEIYWEDDSMQGERPHGTIVNDIYITVNEEPKSNASYITVSYIEEVDKHVSKPELQSFSGYIIGMSQTWILSANTITGCGAVHPPLTNFFVLPLGIL